ncbi:hypothetical protein [Paracoccus sanguinis]|uniref:hypothetical protein n=1 Tax=Paracoccus sanguinis TaxID=1545044 RepID=UPI0012E05378|nr:hypothetical protein [Paracoccus sanguinis]
MSREEILARPDEDRNDRFEKSRNDHRMNRNSKGQHAESEIDEPEASEVRQSSDNSVIREDEPLSEIGRRDELIRAAQLFQEMIDMVEPCGTAVTTAPTEALSSLLRQCEELSASAVEAEVPLFISLPGLPMLDPEWWQEAAGWEVVRLQDADVTSEQLQALRAARAREGKKLIVVVSATVFPTEIADALQPRLLLTCHPWHCFTNPETDRYSLEELSARLLEFLNLYPDLPRYRVDARENKRAGVEELLDFAERKTTVPPPEPRPTSLDVVAIDYLGGAPSYEALCHQLEYNPAGISGPHKSFASKDISSLPSTLTLPQVGQPSALVTWFIDRVSTMPAGAALVPRMRALIPSLDACLSMPAFPEALDEAAGKLRPDDETLLRLLAAAHFQRQENALQSMGLVADALENTTGHLPVYQQIGALLYLEMNRPQQAIEALAAPLTARGLLNERAASALQKAIYGDTPPDAGQHGQALLLAALTEDPPLPAPDGRRRVMIEIGTTREAVPGQGSTRQLAFLCADLDIDFITVDMDPANSRRAARMFKRLALPFRSVTAKGEDYLSAFEGLIDYVFVDAYDFDHGQHSELRQSRYTQFLGGRISDSECHQMHLQCARTLVTKLAPDGLICFDDTWTDEAGAWMAKGTTAMPFLLSNGFTIVEAKNRAALLRRQKLHRGTYPTTTEAITASR